MYYFIRDPEGKIISEVQGTQLAISPSFPGKYALRSVNGCRSSWQIDEIETGTKVAYGRSMDECKQCFHCYQISEGAEGFRRAILRRKIQFGLIEAQ